MAFQGTRDVTGETEDPGKGTYRRYADVKMRPDTLALVGQVAQITDEYEAAGVPMTVRQLFYQFVSRGVLPNSQKSYDRVQAATSDGRMAGLVSWTAIEDRERNLMGTNTLDGPADALRQARRGYAEDLWKTQLMRPEVWVEKLALIGVVGQICQRLRVDYFACKGYTSQSELWRAGGRMRGRLSGGQRPIVFHLGDHDPSGLDMTRDNRERLELFCGAPVQVVRLALNMDQIRQYAPPPNPAKMTDSRAEAYVAEHGSSSWELDALEPRVLAALIEDAVVKVRDGALWSAACASEAENMDVLDGMIEEVT